MNRQEFTGQRLLRRIQDWLTVFCIVCGIAGLAGFGILERRVQNLTARVSQLQAKEALLEAREPLMNMTINDNYDVIDQLRDAFGAICGTRGASSEPALPQALRTQLLQACGRTGLAAASWDATFDFLKTYNRAVRTRLGAQSSADFQNVLTLYRDAAALSAKSTGAHPLVDAHWRVRALEGEAYAQMQLKKFREAQTLARESIALAKKDINYDVYVFANLTEIKAICLEDENDAGAKEKYGELIGELKSLVSKFPNGTDNKRYAEEDLSTAQSDAELKEFCQGRRDLQN